MRGSSDISNVVAIKSAVQLVSEIPTPSAEPTSTDQTVSDESDWFVGMAKALLGKDAGYALSKITGFEERTCYRYAAGDRKIPGYFLRALLRSPIGPQVLAYVMQDGLATWWRDHQRAERIARAFDQIDRS